MADREALGAGGAATSDGKLPLAARRRDLAARELNPREYARRGPGGSVLDMEKNSASAGAQLTQSHCQVYCSPGARPAHLYASAVIGSVAV
jgi:hypothetical protein